MRTSMMRWTINPYASSRSENNKTISAFNRVKYMTRSDQELEHKKIKELSTIFLADSY